MVKSKRLLNEFELDLAWALIENDYFKREEGEKDEEGQRRVGRRVVEHRLEVHPGRL